MKIKPFVSVKKKCLLYAKCIGEKVRISLFLSHECNILSFPTIFCAGKQLLGCNILFLLISVKGFRDHKSALPSHLI